MPKRISPADPAARYTSAHGSKAEFCYATIYLIDVKHAVIMDVEASTAVRQAEVTAAKRMIERVHNDLGIWPRKLIGDTGYGSAANLAWLVHERDIEPHIPVFDKSSRIDGTFSRGDFAAQWGKDRSRFRQLEPRPIAAASIGQVHRAVTRNGRSLAINAQYPGVRERIDPDIDNVATLLRVSGMLPIELDVAALLAEASIQTLCSMRTAIRMAPYQARRLANAASVKTLVPGGSWQ